MRNMMGTLFLSQGVPMLLGGDEIGRTQHGNNNAYCQDNELSWYHWDLDDRRKKLFDFTRRMIQLRKRHQILQQRRFFVGNYIWESQSKDLAWLRPDGVEMTPQDWQKPWIQALAMVLGGDAIPMVDERGERMLDDGVLILMNAHHEPIEFKLPAEAEGGPWLVEIDTSNPDKEADVACKETYKVGGRGLAVLRQPLDTKVAREAAAAPARVVKKEAQRRRRRAGVVIPLFSIRSGKGWGVGDIADIPRFASWAGQAGFSVLQLLPVNPTSGADPSPYSSVSAFALDPVYLALDECEDFQSAGGRDALPEAAAQAGRRGRARRPRRLEGRPRAEERRRRPGVSAIPEGRVGQAHAAQPAAGRVHARQPRLAGRLRALRRLAPADEQGLDGLARGSARPHARGAGPCPARPGCRAAARSLAAMAAEPPVAAGAAPGQRGRGGPDGRPALHRRRGLGGRVGQPRALPDRSPAGDAAGRLFGDGPGLGPAGLRLGGHAPGRLLLDAAARPAQR